jgi:hypothetical protein
MSDGPVYKEVTGELIASFVIFVNAVVAQRPETEAIPGAYVLTINMRDRTVTLGKALTAEGRAVAVIESVGANPDHPEQFGESVLGIVVDPNEPRH